MRTILDHLVLYMSLGRERRDLARLDRRLLADIGLTHEDASDEAARRFYDVPSNRRLSRGVGAAPVPGAPCRGRPLPASPEGETAWGRRFPD